MGRSPDELKAASAAEDVIREFRIEQFPIDPIAIAQAKDILVQGTDRLDRGFSGALVRMGNEFGILYTTRTTSQGFINFTVGHELGHYFIPGHLMAVLPDGVTQHRSRSGFVSHDPIERQADLFAATLLMPERLFVDAMDKVSLGLVGIRKLAGQCQTSLVATALRYAEFTSEVFAVVLSTGSRVDWCVMSEAMREIPGLRWIEKKSLLPGNCLTAQFNADDARVIANEFDEGSCAIGDWFNCDHNYELNEDVIGLGAFGKSLTVLFSDEPFGSDEDDEGDNDY